jgi:hypothetical protein
VVAGGGYRVEVSETTHDTMWVGACWGAGDEWRCAERVAPCVNDMMGCTITSNSGLICLKLIKQHSTVVLFYKNLSND